MSFPLWSAFQDRQRKRRENNKQKCFSSKSSNIFIFKLTAEELFVVKEMYTLCSITNRIDNAFHIDVDIQIIHSISVKAPPSNSICHVFNAFCLNNQMTFYFNVITATDIPLLLLSSWFWQETLFEWGVGNLIYGFLSSKALLLLRKILNMLQIFYLINCSLGIYYYYYYYFESATTTNAFWPRLL